MGASFVCAGFIISQLFGMRNYCIFEIYITVNLIDKILAYINVGLIGVTYISIIVTTCISICQACESTYHF